MCRGHNRKYNFLPKTVVQSQSKFTVFVVVAITIPEIVREFGQLFCVQVAVVFYTLMMMMADKDAQPRTHKQYMRPHIRIVCVDNCEPSSQPLLEDLRLARVSAQMCCARLA